MGGEPVKMPTASTPATAMRYRDVAAAADWLCSALGFEKQTVLADDNGAPLYVQLTFGRAMLMLAPVRPSPIDRYMKQPDEIGGAETQSGYYVVSDADAHYARAKSAGAAIILEIEDDDFGGRTYTCRDPEGHIWTFGTYDPWQGRFPESEAAPAATAGRPSRGVGRRLLRALLTLIVMAGVGVAGWYGGVLTQSRAIVSSTAQPAALERRAALEAAEQAARKALVQLEGERAAKAAADKASEQAQQRAAEEAQARDTAERALKEARAELERVHAIKAAAASGSADLTKRVDEERRAREAAERAARDTRAELEKLQAIKTSTAPGSPDLLKRAEEAERAVKEARAELEKARADKAAAEMAKDFALNRAEEEQAAREEAERATKEARAALDSTKAVPAPVPAGPPPGILKASAEMQRALDEAKKRAADAESAVEEAREQLAKEKTSKNAAWKVVGQLTKQLQTIKGSVDAADLDDPPAKKAKPRPKKKSADSE
jgi:uncharacterized glyoxalase superfamily protein PhnB